MNEPLLGVPLAAGDGEADESAAASSSSAPPVVTRAPPSDEPGSAAAAADPDDGSSAEELAARRALVQGLEGSLSPDEAAFAQAVQAAEVARAQLQAKLASAGATPPRTRLTPSPPTAADAGGAGADASVASRSRSGSIGVSGVPPLGLLNVRRPSLARQPSAPEMMGTWETQSSSPPRDRMQTQQHQSAIGSDVSSAVPAVQAHGGASVGPIPSKLTASPAFGPRHQSLPDLPMLSGLDDSFEVIEGASGADGAEIRQAEPAPFNHLAQRPSFEMFNNGPGKRAATNGSAGGSSGGLPPRKLSNSSGANPLLEPLLAMSDAAYDSSSPDDPSLLHPLPSPTSHDENLKQRREAELAHHNKGLGRRQLRAMLKKNWILKRRNPVQFACELLSPLCMVMVIVVGWILSLSHVSHYGVGKYANNSATAEEIFRWVSNHIVPIEPASPALSPIPVPLPLPSGIGRLDFGELAGDDFSRERRLHAAEPRQALRQRHRNRRLSHADEYEELIPAAAAATSALENDEQSDEFDDSLSYFSALHSGNNGDGGDFYPYLHAKRRQAAFAAAAGLQSSYRPNTTTESLTCFPLDALPGEQFCYAPSEGQDVVTKILDYSGPMHIPHLDEYVSTHLVLQKLLQNATDTTFSDLQDNLDQLDQYTNGKLANIIYLGKLLFAPDVPAVRALVSRLNDTHRLFGRVFTGVEASEAAALARAKSHLHSDSDRTWAILVFNALDLEAGVLDYTIRMNSSVLPTTHSVVDKFQRGIDRDYQDYFWSGFLTLQIMIEEAALGVSSAGPRASDDGIFFSDPSSPPLNPDYTRSQVLTAIPFPVPSYDGNKFYSTIGPIVGLVFCMSMLYPTSRLIKGIVEEKETKTKETMKVSV